MYSSRRRQGSVVLAAIAVTVFSSLARAELQNVEVGGSLEIYGTWHSKFYEPSGAGVRIPVFFLPGRSIGPFGTASSVRADGTGVGSTYVDERTRLHVRADFTDQVSAFTEFDSVSTWGDDFRSNYITGTDFRNLSPDTLDLYQSYIELKAIGGSPLQLRVGRQELSFGKGWLVGTNAAPDPFTSLSFDAIRATYETDKLTLDGWWSKLAENSPREQDGDVDFYGVYAAFRPTKETSFDAYWMFVRDAAAVNDTNFAWFPERVEDALSVDNYGVTSLHTVGLRATGKAMGIDWDLEGAYQLGTADAVGALFKPSAYGDARAKWNTWAARVELGYTFEARFQPRLYVNGAYYDGEDKRRLSLREWISPFDRPHASVSFNRLFSDYEQDAMHDGSTLTNFWLARTGLQVNVTESVQLTADLVYLQAVAPFARPASIKLGRWLIPVAPNLSFWDRVGAKDLGWQFSLTACYTYSEDLQFEAGWTHYFVGDAIQDGSFIDFNGLAFIGGIGKHDADFLYYMTSLSF